MRLRGCCFTFQRIAGWHHVRLIIISSARSSGLRCPRVCDCGRATRPRLPHARRPFALRCCAAGGAARARGCSAPRRLTRDEGVRGGHGHDGADGACARAGRRRGPRLAGCGAKLRAQSAGGAALGGAPQRLAGGPAAPATPACHHTVRAHLPRPLSPGRTPSLRHSNRIPLVAQGDGPSCAAIWVKPANVRTLGTLPSKGGQHTRAEWASCE